MIRPGAIGDCLLALPALEHLKSGYTEVWISSALVPLIHFADCVRPISATQLDWVGLADPAVPVALANKLREFDEIVSWYGCNRPAFRTALETINPRCIFLEALPGIDVLEHASDFFLCQVGAPRGQISQLRVAPIESRRAIVIHPFSGSPRKNWPLERYRALAEQLTVPVEWTAGPEESLDHAVRFEDLSQLASWMRGAVAYIGNDSGISHLAAAIGLPSLILFGHTNPLIWGPRGANVKILHHHPLSELSVEQVHRQLNDLSAAVLDNQSSPGIQLP